MYYSQYGEDKFLNENFFKNMENGTYIELGALDGNLYSNTKFYEETLNWTGILIEPHPIKFKSLELNRPNNFTFGDLVSCYKEELKFRWIDGIEAVSGVENTLSKHHMDDYYNKYTNLNQDFILMKPKSLTEIIKSTNIKNITFLSLDVEGHEYEVLQSWDFSIPIELILIETLGVSPEKDELCREILIKNNYIFISKYLHNEIYIHNTSMLNNKI
jgi:FkbM family methyltransferase